MENDELKLEENEALKTKTQYNTKYNVMVSKWVVGFKPIDHFTQITLLSVLSTSTIIAHHNNDHKLYKLMFIN